MSPDTIRHLRILKAAALKAGSGPAMIEYRDALQQAAPELLAEAERNLAAHTFVAKIFAPGERSVGIWPTTISVVFHGFNAPENFDPNRNTLRDDLVEMFNGFLDAKTTVHFDDECGGCGSRLVMMDGRWGCSKCPI